MRPVNGAVTRENSRSSCASLIAALAVSMAACALRWSAARWSTFSAVPKSVRLSCCARQSSASAQRLLGLRGLELRDSLIEPDLERPRVDDEERIALVHDLPVLEVDRGQGAADLRAQLHAVHRRELAEEAAGGLHRLLQRQADGHLRRRGRRRRQGRRLASQRTARRPPRPAPPRCRRARGRATGCRRRTGGRLSPATRVRSATSWSVREMLSMSRPQSVILLMLRWPRSSAGRGRRACGTRPAGYAERDSCASASVGYRPLRLRSREPCRRSLIVATLYH